MQTEYTDQLGSSGSRDSLLYGFDDTTHILAVHLNHQNNSTVAVYRRVENGVECDHVSFYPFFHLTDRSLIADFPKKHWVKDLTGDGTYRCLCAFPSWSGMWEGVHYISNEFAHRFGIKLDISSSDPVLLRTDPACQYFLQSGQTSFCGMNFTDLHRMQISLAIHSSQGYSNADRDADRIMSIALSDNRGWNDVLLSKKLSEEDLLTQCITLIRERDPDVIEGHHIISFELPYLLKRCARYGIAFSIGRDGSEPTVSSPRSADMEGESPFILIHGRHVIDSAHFLSQFDYAKRDSFTTSLREAALQFGYSVPERIFIPAQKYAWYFENDPELLRIHLHENVKEIEKICACFSQSIFHLASMIPLNYGALFLTGSAIKIELLMLREYIRTRESLPLPEKGMHTVGAYSDIFFTGLFSPILHVDVESMYPSIMIRQRLAPKSDSLGIFLTLLEELTAHRIEAKRAMQAEENSVRKTELDVLQSSLKILINSFYGYLGYSRALFNDMEMASTVVSEGQTIVRTLIVEIRNAGGIPIEVDTDGVYLVPPIHIDDEEKEILFVDDIDRRLPDGIHIIRAARYKKMLSYKIKNYALLDSNDRLILKGSSLTARNMEQFAKNYVESCVECLMREDIQGLHDLYKNVIFDFSNRNMNVRDFVRTETLRTSLEEYLKERQEGPASRLHHSAVHEALARAARHARVGERIAFYYAGSDPGAKPYQMAKLADEWNSSAPDENINYYLRRVDELSGRFKIFFHEKDFARIFSAEEGLFAFDPTDIRILSKQVESAERGKYGIEWDVGGEE